MLHAILLQKEDDKGERKTNGNMLRKENRNHYRIVVVEFFHVLSVIASPVIRAYVVAHNKIQ